MAKEKGSMVRRRPKSKQNLSPKSVAGSSQKSLPSKSGSKKASSKTQLSEPKYFRLLLVWGFLLLSSVGLGVNLYQLQMVKSPQLKNEARKQQMISLRPYVPRRSIVDRKNNVLATDRLVYNLYAHPKLFKVSHDEIVAKLASVLTQDKPVDLRQKLGEKASGIRLAKRLSENDAQDIRQLNLDGLELIRQYSRFYPHQEMVAEITGHTDLEHNGVAGIEYSQEKWLERSIRSVWLKRAGNGKLMPSNIADGFLSFDKLQLQLTIDLRLQRSARLYLKQQIKKYRAKRGAVIVMDSNDGSILALVNEPNYNPNNYFDYGIELFKNWAVTDLYEPGSTFKPINVAIALDAGAIQPNTTVYDSGTVKIGTWDISNYDYRDRGARGTQSVAQILQHSSNIGMIKLMEKMRPSNYYDALKDLGMRERVGIELLGEASGQLKSRRDFTSLAIEPATASFGQGLSLTPIKLVQLHAAIANGGKLVTPHVVKAVTDSEGQVHWQPDHSTRPVFSPETSKNVLTMMESVVSRGGVRKYAYINRYRVAGKTGTAQKASPNGGYYDNAKITSFVGIIPVEAPRYVVLAVVDEPQGKDVFGSTVAAPVVKSVMEALISVENIPPTR